MAKNFVFYKGRRKKRNYTIIPFAVALGLLALIVVLFYGMQKYAVIEKDGVAVKLPILNGGEDVTAPENGSDVKIFDPVDVDLTFDAADYSDIKATAGDNVEPVRAIFVPSTDLNSEKLAEYTARLNQANALVLEMKPNLGNLMWYSGSQASLGYGLSTQDDVTSSVPGLVAMLKEQKVNDSDIYLVAQISCCIDEYYASRCTTVALRAPYGGSYVNEEGTWLDPYSTEVREYVIEMVRELYAMGFDEVVLANVLHPTLKENEEILYTRAMSTDPSPVNAVCGFAVSVAQALEDRPEGKYLSIYCYEPSSLVKANDTNGSDAPLFFKLYDRVYYNTDKYTYTFNFTDIQGEVELGDAAYRFVPVLENYLPNNSNEVSWVLVDVEEDEEE